MDEMDHVVEVHDVSKKYLLGKTVVPALHNVSLKIERKSFTAIIGPSGSGKSTLLDIIGCIGRPSSGYVTINGEDISKYGDDRLSTFRARNIGFVFQTFNLIDVFSAFENVEYPLILLKMGKKEREKKVLDILERVGLADFVKHRPNELSGGQRQRVAVARSMVASPSFVLADEPTANLDSATGMAILDLMVELNRSMGTTFIFATHDKMVMQRSTKVFSLKDGKVVENQ